MQPPHRSVVLPALLLLFTNSLSAQTVVGRVLDAATAGPITGAQVVVDEGDFEALTDSLGLFVLRHVPTGPHVLEVRHIAYGNHVDSLSIPDDDGTIELIVEVAPRPIAVDPIEVTVLSTVERRRRAQGHSQHVFVTRPDLDRYEARGALNVGEALRMHDGHAVNVRPAAAGANTVGLCVESGRAATRRSASPKAPPGVMERIRGEAAKPMPRPDVQVLAQCAFPAVFVDGLRLNPMQVPAFLDQLPLASVETLELLPPTEGTFRYGAYAENGALVIDTRGGLPTAAGAEAELTPEELIERIRAETRPKRWHYPMVGALVGVVAAGAYLTYRGNSLFEVCGTAECSYRGMSKPFLAFFTGVALGGLAGEIAFRVGVGGPP